MGAFYRAFAMVSLISSDWNVIQRFPRRTSKRPNEYPDGYPIGNSSFFSFLRFEFENWLKSFSLKTLLSENGSVIFTEDSSVPVY